LKAIQNGSKGCREEGTVLILMRHEGGSGSYGFARTMEESILISNYVSGFDEAARYKGLKVDAGKWI